MHGAGAALARIAPDMRTCQPQIVAQELNQQGTVFNLRTADLSVHCHGHAGHIESSRYAANSNGGKRHEIPKSLAAVPPRIACRSAGLKLQESISLTGCCSAMAKGSSVPIRTRSLPAISQTKR